MGEFKFKVPADWPLDPYHGNSIHIVGMDGVPWPCRIAVSTEAEVEQQRVITINRNQTDSGKLFVQFDFADRGEHLICTGTLPPDNDDPYDLMVELARGTLNRLRNQVSIWEEGGLVISDSVLGGIADATTHFRDSIFAKSAQQVETFARNAIEMAMVAIYELAETFADQICKFRREHPDLSNFWIANQIGVGDQLEASFNMDFAQLVSGQLEISPESSIDGQAAPAEIARVACASKEQFEACGKRVIVGPFLDASIGGMSKLPTGGEDFLARKEFVLNRTRAGLESLPSNVSMLHLVSGLNGTGHRHLSYPQQLQATVDLLQAAQDSSAQVPAMVSFDFPWAERLSGAVGGVHPLQIADSMLRQDVQIAFLGLDINLDFWPNGSAVRDPLQWIDLVDVWAQLGMPLVLNLRVPMSVGDGSLKGQESRNQICSNHSDDHRIDCLKTVLPMLVARPSVHGMILRQWQDADDPRYPYAGLVDSTGNKKEIFDVLGKVMEAIDPD
jgi:hypothetical protein